VRQGSNKKWLGFGLLVYLDGHIIGGGAVEMFVGPLEELFFFVDVLGFGV
jgi:hypothetical protein